MHYLLGLTSSGVQNLIQVDQYMSFAMAMMLAFGLAFEVPLLLVTPSRRRMASPAASPHRGHPPVPHPLARVAAGS
jgi:Sec-independent protein secretion pathway component TatC